MKITAGLMTKERWQELLKEKEKEIKDIYDLKDIDPLAFDDYCKSAVIKYKTKLDTFKEYLLNSPLWEVAETLTSIEYGKRP